MRAIAVYEPTLGETHEIAETIADGLASKYDVTVVPGNRVATEQRAGVNQHGPAPHLDRLLDISEGTP
jgi:menaquinone-dependent protoporphyrinogen IX oxidase